MAREPLAAAPKRWQPRSKEKSERGRGIDPQNPGLRTPRVFPAMRGGAFEIKAVTGLQPVMTLIVQPDLKFAAQDVEKFFTLVSVGFSAAPAAFDAKEVRLHDGIAPGEKLHADLRAGFEDFALGRANEGLGVPVRFKHGENIGVVKTRDTLERGHRGAHLTALESAEKTDGNFGGTRDLSERKTAL